MKNDICDYKQVKCDVCGKDIWIDEYGNSDDCPNCGWRQTEESFEHPDVAAIRNIPTLNNARKQYAEGKSALLANFNDFIQAYENYGEVQFTYNDITYGVLYNDPVKCVMLYNTKTEKEQNHNTLKDFVNNANINGKLLKDIWSEVTNTDFLQ